MQFLAAFKLPEVTKRPEPASQLIFEIWETMEKTNYVTAKYNDEPVAIGHQCKAGEKCPIEKMIEFVGQRTYFNNANEACKIQKDALIE